MWRVPSCSLFLMAGRVLIAVNFLVGGVVAIGQEPSMLPDGPSASPTQSGPSSSAQDSQRHEPSQNHIFWISPRRQRNECPVERHQTQPKPKMKVALDDSFD